MANKNREEVPGRKYLYPLYLSKDGNLCFEDIDQEVYSYSEDIDESEMEKIHTLLLENNNSYYYNSLQVEPLLYFYLKYEYVEGIKYCLNEAEMDIFDFPRNELVVKSSSYTLTSIFDYYPENFRQRHKHVEPNVIVDTNKIVISTYSFDYTVKKVSHRDWDVWYLTYEDYMKKGLYNDRNYCLYDSEVNFRDLNIGNRDLSYFEYVGRIKNKLEIYPLILSFSIICVNIKRLYELRDFMLYATIYDLSKDKSDDLLEVLRILVNVYDFDYDFKAPSTVKKDNNQVTIPIVTFAIKLGCDVDVLKILLSEKTFCDCLSFSVYIDEEYSYYQYLAWVISQYPNAEESEIIDLIVLLNQSGACEGLDDSRGVETIPICVERDYVRIVAHLMDYIDWDYVYLMRKTKNRTMLKALSCEFDASLVPWYAPVKKEVFIEVFLAVKLKKKSFKKELIFCLLTQIKRIEKPAMKESKYFSALMKFF